MATIPFSVLPLSIVTKLSQYFIGVGDHLAKAFPSLQLELDRADMKFDARKYVAMCLVSVLFLFFILGIGLTLLLLKIGHPFYGIVIAIVFSLVIFLMQMRYPTLAAYNRIRKLDADLLSALSAIMIQLHSGVSLFEALVMISKQEFGEVSNEFKKVTNKINAGESQVVAMELMVLKNPSPYFRKTIWQIINGMKEGASTTTVIDTVFSNLREEQLIQIEKYGSQLSPIMTFYMVCVVIFPALGIALLLMLSSFITIEVLLAKMFFGAILGFVVFFQIMFAGVIKTKRPSLLGE